MCGIVGGINHSGSTGRDMITEALAKMKHRGPDAEGIYESSPVFLGHRRLSIIDPNPRANQPFRLGPFVITFNGEIYNYRSVRQDLERLGFSFETESDTEVILAAFRHEGINCLKRFEGMFAFAIWDEEKKQLTLARDRFGEKPLIYYMDREQFLFASEIPPLETLVGRDRLEINEEAISLYFQLSYIPAPHSPYRRMQQLEPSHWLQLDAASWTIQTNKYYTLSPKPCLINKNDAVAELRRRLSDSINLRLSAADVPVATFLSGGIDSSIVSALASDLSSSGVRAYSIGFPDDPGFDESPYARMVAKQHPNIRHTVIHANESLLLDFTDRTLSLVGEPYGDASIIPTAFLCSHVEEKVILGGDGADELFAGYGVYAAMRASARLPRLLKHLARCLPIPGNPHNIANAKLRAFALFQSHLKDNPLDEYFSWRSYGSVSDIQALGVGSDADIHSIVGNPTLDTLNDLLALDIHFNLPNDMLKKADLASMQHGLEIRLPYLDSGIVEFALSLPENLLIHNGERKHILREAYQDLLPKPVLTRRKQGFLLPMRRWFATGALKDRLLDMINLNCPLDKTAVRSLLDEHQKGIHDHSVLLWNCYVYCKWLNR